ncbi:MAG: methyltransferase domain-containing protein [Oculatellaceae cyanobacterium Prado106]|nr:methyltransferase domain-containing protein [Oculatellaceae cyanobacterium Prado106]
MKWNPEDYARNSDAQLKWARELRQNLSLQGNESVLDVGCGDGKITADFAVTLVDGRVVGVDSSPEMIAYATRAYGAEQFPNLAFACVDARALHFEDEFDLCFSNAALHWVEDHLAVLRGIGRSLHPQGRLIISCGGQGNAAEVLQVFAELISREPWQRYFDDFRNPYFFYGTQDYATWLHQAGFQINRLELVPKTMTHVGQAGLAGWIRTTWMPFTEQVPEVERDRFIADFTETYLTQSPLDQQGFAQVRMVRLEVDAVHRQNP